MHLCTQQTVPSSCDFPHVLPLSGSLVLCTISILEVEKEHQEPGPETYHQNLRAVASRIAGGPCREGPAKANWSWSVTSCIIDRHILASA